MINDVVIIKDGIPLLSRNFSDTKSIFSRQDNLIMISGFFSALNSFSDQFDDLGSISELKLSNNDFKLSFFKDKSIPNLIYLASYDEKSNSVNVQRYLRKISQTFLKKYSITQILNWCGRADRFGSFEEIIEKFVDEEKKENDVGFKDRVLKLFDIMKEKLDENNDNSEFRMPKDLKVRDFKEKIKKKEIVTLIPCFKTSNKINPKYYLTGEVSHKVFNQIDSKKSVNQIADNLKITSDAVHNICKVLVKMGFITLC